MSTTPKNLPAKRGVTVDDSATGLTESQSHELGTAGAASAARAQVEAAFLMAKRFPRNEELAYSRLLTSCKRPTFAEDAAYSFPRGDSLVTGPSVYLAREAGRLWGNIDYGFTVVSDDLENRTLMAYAVDLETNTRATAGDSFRKLVQRKQKGGGTAWIVPDERDLRELTNRRAAILIRNCILQLLPTDLIDDALGEAAKTEKAGVNRDPRKAAADVLRAFAGLGVPADDLQAFLGCPVAKADAEQIAKLRLIFKAIQDGQAKWGDFAKQGAAQPPKPTPTAGNGPVTTDALKGAAVAPAAQAPKPEPEPEEAGPDDETDLEPEPPVEPAPATQEPADPWYDIQAQIDVCDSLQACLTLYQTHYMALRDDAARLAEFERRLNLRMAAVKAA